MADKIESKIDKSMVIRGEVYSTNPVIVEGKVEGAFTGQSLVIHEMGQVTGDITGKSIECFGRLEGNIVTETLILRKTGCHVGTVETRELEVEPGAILDCALQSGTPKKRRPEPKVVKVVEEMPIDLGKVVTAFQEGVRPCCMDVPWSNRLELYNHLLELLEKGKQLIKVTGESGSGKSVLVRKLQENLPDTIETLLLTYQIGSVAVLLQKVGSSLGVENSGQKPQNELLAQIKSVVDRKRSQGRRVVLLVDDTQEMYPASMEGIIRHLTKTYGDGEEMLQMILLGTRDMEEKMVATTIEYFEDETNCQLDLEPMTIKELGDYLRFSLQLAAGADSKPYMSLFPFESIKKIHDMSHGNIAEINRLADRALHATTKAGATVVAPDFC